MSAVGLRGGLGFSPHCVCPRVITRGPENIDLGVHLWVANKFQRVGKSANTEPSNSKGGN